MIGLWFQTSGSNASQKQWLWVLSLISQSSMALTTSSRFSSWNSHGVKKTKLLIYPVMSQGSTCYLQTVLSFLLLVFILVTPHKHCSCPLSDLYLIVEFINRGYYLQWRIVPCKIKSGLEQSCSNAYSIIPGSLACIASMTSLSARNTHFFTHSNKVPTAYNHTVDRGIIESFDLNKEGTFSKIRWKWGTSTLTNCSSSSLSCFK